MEELKNFKRKEYIIDIFNDIKLSVCMNVDMWWVINFSNTW